MQTKDWSAVPSLPTAAGGGETVWVVPEKFFDQFGELLDIAPPLPGEEAMYGAQFRLLMACAKADPTIKAAITEAAIETENDVIKPFLQ